MRKEFCYVFSSELHVPLRVRLVSLSGYIPKNTLEHFTISSGCIFVRLIVYCNGRAVGRFVQSSFRQHVITTSVNNRDIQRFDEWLTLPLMYSELSRDAILHITVWEVSNSLEPVLIAQCAKPLFSKHSIFRTGLMDLKLENIQNVDKRLVIRTTTSDEKITTIDSNIQPDHLEDVDATTPLLCTNNPVRSTSQKSHGVQFTDLLKKEKLYNQKFVQRIDWLDRITFAKIEEIKQEAKTLENSLFLTVEFPMLQHSDDVSVYSIIFFAEDIPLTGCQDVQLDDEFSSDPLLSNKRVDKKIDAELDMENLCEIKHHMMTRNARAMDIDRRLQPNSVIKNTLELIIKSSSCQSMMMEERDLIWKFRFWLKSNPKALTKFVRSVNWQEKLEVRQAIQVILEWEPIDACDALELLSSNFKHTFVRRYAVSRLQCTTYANILLFLPQLVQALRYESIHYDLTSINDNDMSIVTMVDNNQSSKINYDSIDAELPINFYNGPESMDLVTFLIKVACRNNHIANFLYWYLKVEAEANMGNKKVSNMYSSAIAKLKEALATGSRQTLATIAAQMKFVDTLVNIATKVAEVSGNRSKKLETLKKKLMDNNDMMDLKGLSLPLDPSIHVKAIQPESSVLFSSNLMPMRLTFSTVRGNITPYECSEVYTTIFKRGDDLRQDQLVLQMIRLMDSLLKEDKLDLCLTPYSVLATSCSEGFVQFIRGATPLADIKSIQDTLRTFRPSISSPYGIEVEALNNYVKSCAGYCVICYILGIGDRHLHNLLLCENGKMFHVDFGFILGRDPKPMPPPMKLTSDMINAMGGQNSEHFRAFVNYCTIAFCILRRHANLITNLFSLMLDAGIPDIAIERDKAVMKVLERFHLQLSDEAACQLIVRLIESSLSAKMPLIVDFVHNVRQYISN